METNNLKIILATLIIVSLILLSGCTEKPVCGDGTCQIVEQEFTIAENGKEITNIYYCPKDCENHNLDILLIGNSSFETIAFLDGLKQSHNRNYFHWDLSKTNTTKNVSKYNIVILDQSQSTDKGVSMALGKEIEEYVNNGGKLIVVGNSGIYSNEFPIVIGWKATFGNIMPMECSSNSNGMSTCKEGMEIQITGKVYPQDYEHPILKGILITPRQSTYTIFPIGINEGSKPIAYIKAEGTSQTHPAILEKKHVGSGKVIYFNYNPAQTPGIFLNTLDYLNVK